MNQAEFHEVTIAHAIPGRIRLRCGGLIASPERAEALRSHVEGLPGLLECEVRPASGSLVLHYEPAGEQAVWRRLGELFPALRASPEPPGDEAAGGEAARGEAASHEAARGEAAAGQAARGRAAEGRGASGDQANGRYVPPEFWSGGTFPADELGQTIASVFTVLNRRFERLTGSLDLRVAVPVMLALMGAASLVLTLLRRRRLPLPQWYDFFWFAFGTFLSLNASAVESVWNTRQDEESSETVHEDASGRSHRSRDPRTGPFAG